MFTQKMRFYSMGICSFDTQGRGLLQLRPKMQPLCPDMSRIAVSASRWLDKSAGERVSVLGLDRSSDQGYGFLGNYWSANGS
jgi:hypothetical protein